MGQPSLRTVAALFVAPDGPYPTMPGVECWDEARDARTYDGPYPVVAHPPCARWCKLAKFVESQYGHQVGDDGGTFAAALRAVRTWGGVLEHPAFSLAWAAHCLVDPPEGGGWQRTLDGEWVCDIAQSAYGHVATKRTWLLLCKADPPAGETDWRRPKGEKVIGSSTVRPDGTVDRRNDTRLHDARAIHTPQAFADYLVTLARRVEPPVESVMERLAQAARERVANGEVDAWGRHRPDGPRKQLTPAQLRAWGRARGEGAARGR